MRARTLRKIVHYNIFLFDFVVHLRYCDDDSVLLISADQLNDEQQVLINMAGAGARALYSLSESKPNKEAMRKFGLVPLMSRLLKSVHTELIIPIIGTCQNCASEVNEKHIVIQKMKKKKHTLYTTLTHK